MTLKIPLLALLSATALAAAGYADAPPKGRIPYMNARKTALGACPGRVFSSGLEQRDGVWIYTFEIQSGRGGGRRPCEILIDAMTGQRAVDAGGSKRMKRH